MSYENSRWEMWGAIAVNASSGVTAARTVTSQSGKFNQSRGATGISQVQAGVWIVRLRNGQGVSGPDCYAAVTPRATQSFATALAGNVATGAVTMAANHDSQTAKRITIMVLRHHDAASSAVGMRRRDVPFDLRIYRRTE